MLYQELTDFILSANYPYVPILTGAAETGQVLQSIIGEIPATVPGCVHSDLLRAGWIEDPYYEMNALKSGWVESYWWTYKTTFTPDPALRGRHLRLKLWGVDYHAVISLNGVSLGEHVGMYVPCVREVTELVKFGEENTLSVLLLDAPKEMGQIGYTSRTYTQKARFPYKWDFSTRLVQVGLYDKVTLEDFGLAALEYTHVKNQGDTITAKSELTVFAPGDVTLRYTLRQGEEVVCQAEIIHALEKGSATVTQSLTVENPALWYPNGLGEPNLYELTVEVLDEGGKSDEKRCNVGFRTREYLMPEGAPVDALPYGLAINGKRVYIRGVNMVPMDIMYGTIKPQKVRETLTLARDMGVNLIRVWGGGLIESETFYDTCDQLGLMVWQEFIQSSSGVDNEPSKLPEFLDLCSKTAIHAVKTKVHHPCLTFWCGGNELTGPNWTPVDGTDSNIAMLQEIVSRYDGETFFLPTSATGPYEYLNPDHVGQNYDVHGPWKYEGTERHYDLYNRSDSLLHSEFGIDGMNPYESIKTVLDPKNLRVQSMENLTWRFHGEMWDTFDRDRDIFGPLPQDALKIFIRSSQFVQAEALKYTIEANRRRAFQNVGSIIWQFNEPWPNVSGTNLVDYYGGRKLAYYAVKEAFRKAYPSLRYDKLLFAPGEEGRFVLYMTSDYAPAAWRVGVIIRTMAGKVLFERNLDATVGDGKSVAAGEWKLNMPSSGSVVVKLIAENGKERVENHYILFVKDADGHASRADMLAFAEEYYPVAE
ncbi:MAG: hypothetical protein IJN58_07555 [Clostridia bacterium]|nr:hypothetical protein [Clostridia bacterium]